MDERLNSVSIRSTVRRVPGAHRSRYESSWPATFTSLAPGSSAPPCGRIESASAAKVARRAAVKDMPCDYAFIATTRLRLLLRIWTVIFLLGAVDFFIFPYLTVRILNSTARSLGMHEVTARNGQARSDGEHRCGVAGDGRPHQPDGGHRGAGPRRACGPQAPAFASRPPPQTVRSL